MKIIKPGDPERMEKARQFECPDCGCVFVANISEYMKTPDYRNGTLLVCECPTCGRRVTRDD